MRQHVANAVSANAPAEAPAEAPAFPEQDHDHARCVEDAIADAVTRCAERGARLTPLRRRVLEIVWQSHRPLGAYAILDVLSAEGRTAAPPTVYRALDFLLAHGLLHRIASLNAFVGCSDPGHRTSCQFLICEGCGTALELRDAGIEAAIERVGEERGFSGRRHTVEIAGRCPTCR